MAGMIRIICPNLSCRTVLSVPPESRGKKVRCKLCGGHVTVPKKSAAPLETEPTTGKVDTTAA